MTRIAIIDPLGDPGIGTYTHELASAVHDAGVHVDVFTTEDAWITALPRRHALYPVLGSALAHQAERLRYPAATPIAKGPRTERNGDGSPKHSAATAAQRAGPLRVWFRDTYLNVELAAWLRARGYDAIWTQWPTLPDKGISFWSAARALGLRVIHTAHNVFPHEIAPGDRERSEHVYRRSHKILVHSDMAFASLAREFPFTRGKLIMSRHGLYTTYPAVPGGRSRIRTALGIAVDRTVALFYGGVRPYKNVDAAIAALAQSGNDHFELIVAGHERGYSDTTSTDPLHRTRQLVVRSGVADRVHLLGGPFSYEQTSELFAAADVVLLPYLESWGSGLLCLAMSLGRPVVVTRTGGMEEYVRDYPGAIVLDDPSPSSILASLRSIRMSPLPAQLARPANLEWPHIVRQLLPKLVSGQISSSRAPGETGDRLKAERDLDVEVSALRADVLS